MRTLSFPQNLISDYYNYSFGKDLRSYFKIESLGNSRNDIAFIGSLERHFNSNRISDGYPAQSTHSILDNQRAGKIEYETEKNFIFAGIFYFIILVPQTLREMFGEEVEYDFYRSTGWPLVSAGLGGYLPPAQMLEEASLMPCEVERENYHRMLDEVSRFMLDEISDFFLQKNRRNLNERAYNRMIASISVKTEDLLSRIKAESEAFSKSFE